MEIGEAVIAEPVGQRLGAPPLRRKPPERPLQVQNDGRAIGRDRGGEVRPLGDPDGPLGPLLRRPDHGGAPGEQEEAPEPPHRHRS